jgi:integrase
MPREAKKHRGIETLYDATGRPVAYRYRIADAKGKIIRGRRWDTVSEALADMEKARVARREGDELSQQASRWTMAQELDDYKAVLLSSTKRTVPGMLIFYRWWKAFFGTELLLNHVRPKHIEDARAMLRHGYVVNEHGTLAMPESPTPRSPARVNRYTDWLRRVCNVARKQGRLKRENPVGLIERYEEIKEPPSPYGFGQLMRLYDELGDEADWLRLAIMTNMRQADQFTMRKEQIDFARRIITIPRPKNKKPRMVQLSVEAIDVLQRQIGKSPLDCPWVFPGTLRRGPDGGYNPLNAQWYYKKRFKPACERAGIPLVKGAKLWHNARDTFGSIMAELGYQEHTIMKAGGWGSQEAVLHYIHVADPVTREAMERVSQLVSQEGVKKHSQLGGNRGKLSKNCHVKFRNQH